MDEQTTIIILLVLVGMCFMCVSSSGLLMVASNQTKKKNKNQQRPGANPPRSIAKSPMFGLSDSKKTGTVGEILFNPKYGDEKHAQALQAMWAKEEGKNVAGGEKALGTLLKSGGDYVCNDGDYVRQFTLYSQDQWTANGLSGECYNAQQQLVYPLIDTVAKFFPNFGPSIRTQLQEHPPQMPSSWAFASNVAGRGNETKNKATQIFNAIGNFFSGVVNGVGGMLGISKQIPQAKDLNYFKPYYLDSEGAGFNVIKTWSDPTDKGLRALEFRTPDGKVLGPVGTSSTWKGAKQKRVVKAYTCPSGTRIVGVHPRVIRDERNRRNTDLVGIQVMCA